MEMNPNPLASPPILTPRPGNGAAAAAEAIHKIDPAISRVALSAHQAVNQVADAAEPAAAWLAEQKASLIATQRSLSTEAAQMVSAHPFKSLGIALGVGFVLSRLLPSITGK